MAQYYFTKKAIADLSDIWEYTFETWSETQADKYYQLIIDACSAIAKNPKKGKPYTEIYPDLFAKKLSKHIIFFRVIDNANIEITRILHEEMDLKSKRLK